MEKRRLLLVTGKFPGVSHDTDGGSTMVRQLIDLFGADSMLDVLFTRSINDNYKKINGVNKVFFHPCRFRDDNKFIRRILNADWNRNKIMQLIDGYDKVIIIHCSKAFGLEHLNQEQIKKVVLFPMFLSSSYKRSGETVPDEYTLLEQKVLSKMKTIITPSFVEKEDLISEYSISEQNIIIVPRAINHAIKKKERSRSKENNIIYIGSFKKQKRPEDALKIIVELKRMGLKAHLFMIGSVQDVEIFEQCKKIIHKNNIGSDVSILGVLSQNELPGLLERMDVNISVSKWETFGRGIIEGLASGLPTVVYSQLTCLKQLLPPESGLLFAKNKNEMASIVYELCTNPAFYKSKSEQTTMVAQRFSLSKQKEALSHCLEDDSMKTAPM